MNFSEFLNSLVGVPHETKPVEINPIKVDDIEVTCCAKCPFVRDAQNMCVKECSLVEYYTMLDPTIIQPNCPLRVKPITVSLKEKDDEIRHDSRIKP